MLPAKLGTHSVQITAGNTRFGIAFTPTATMPIAVCVGALNNSGASPEWAPLCTRPTRVVTQGNHRGAFACYLSGHLFCAPFADMGMAVLIAKHGDNFLHKLGAESNYLSIYLSISYNMDQQLKRNYEELLTNHWGFLDEPWPERAIATNHRTVHKDIPMMDQVKAVLVKRLGAIPVYFFLVVLWSQHEYPGPYREVDKGLLILYHLVKGLPMDGLSVFIPKSSFHLIHTHFYKREYAAHSKRITHLLATMFSSVTIRLLVAKVNNPPLFKHVTLHLDGHDTRATYGESSADMYSYKLKKSGLRTQVCMDSSGMAILVSKSQACKNNNDGTMLVDLKIQNHIHEMDCLALDGGYTQYLPTILEKSDLRRTNFCTPIRKKRQQELTSNEASYNSMFGSFRSQMEALFGELGRTFERHNNRSPILVDKRQTYNLQLK
ncbi:hypothetical protein EDD11_010609, partial [Mortierella claussenii]